MGMGSITTEHTVWCGTCEEWEQLNTRTKSQTAREARARGWSKSRGKWQCPSCTEAISRAKTKPIPAK